MAEEIFDLIEFLKGPTPFHVAEEVKSRLDRSGFRPLDHQEPIRGGGGYYASTEGSVIAFYLPDLPEQDWSSLTRLPLRIWGAHTDSPTLKVKPRPMMKGPPSRIGTSVYGGAILNTWLDRPLSLAGKVCVQGEAGIEEHLLNIPEPFLVIPNAAIHLNRNINKGFIISPDTHLPAFYSVRKGMDLEKGDWLAHLAERAAIKGTILSHDLFLYDPQPPMLLEETYLNASRLDNLAMVHAGLAGFLRSIKSEKTGETSPFLPTLAFFNHEEVGSMSYEGAASGFLLAEIESLYQRLLPLSPQLTLHASRKGSAIISADMAHGFHPHYQSWHEEGHRPILNGGPVIKYNASFRYASTASSTALVKNILSRAGLPIQEYLHHGDIPCGSTIGPIVSGRLSIPAVDLGSPLWAMHSIRETAGVKDHLMMIQLAEKYFQGE